MEGERSCTYAVGLVPEKLPRLARLIQRGVRVGGITDSLTLAEAISRAAVAESVMVELMIELDSGERRGGLAAGSLAVVELGQALHDLPGTRLGGVLTHAGNSYRCRSLRALQEVAEQERLAAVTAAEQDALSQHGAGGSEGKAAEAVADVEDDAAAASIQDVLADPAAADDGGVGEGAEALGQHVAGAQRLEHLFPAGRGEADMGHDGKVQILGHIDGEEERRKARAAASPRADTGRGPFQGTIWAETPEGSWVV